MLRLADAREYKKWILGVLSQRFSAFILYSLFVRFHGSLFSIVMGVSLPAYVEGQYPRVGWLFLDLNSYFASVEQQDRPELRGRPVGIVAVNTDSTCCLAHRHTNISSPGAFWSVAERNENENFG